MSKRLLRLTISLAALAVTLFAFTSSEARGAAGSCRNVAPFCSDECSCGAMRCEADCSDTEPCDFGGDSDQTVWCVDQLY